MLGFDRRVGPENGLDDVRGEVVLDCIAPIRDGLDISLGWREGGHERDASEVTVALRLHTLMV